MRPKTRIIVKLLINYNYLKFHYIANFKKTYKINQKNTVEDITCEVLIKCQLFKTTTKSKYFKRKKIGGLSQIPV